MRLEGMRKGRSLRQDLFTYQVYIWIIDGEGEGVEGNKGIGEGLEGVLAAQMAGVQMGIKDHAQTGVEDNDKDFQPNPKHDGG